MNPFSSIAHDMVERSYSVVPIIPGGSIAPDGTLVPGHGKSPGKYGQDAKTGQYRWWSMSEWNEYANRLPSNAEIKYWSELSGVGIGVVCGPISNLIAIDFDYDIDGLHEKIKALLPDSPVKKMGAKGFTAFYQYSGQESTTWRLKGQVVAEILSARKGDDGFYHARQTVLPPSMHPDGMEYKWLTDHTLLSIVKLPMIPVDFVSQVDALFAAYNPQPARQVVSYIDHYSDQFGAATIYEVEEALRFIHPDCEYHMWLEIGMAIKTHFGDDGFETWNHWSSQGAKYKPKQMPGKWKSFRRDEKQIASVFYFAQQHGWVWTPSNQPTLDLADLIEGTLLSKLSAKIETVKIEAPIKVEATTQIVEVPLEPPAMLSPPAKLTGLEAINRPELLDAPGTVGKIANWITGTALYPQPWLAMAAAIACMGIVKGHKVKTRTDLRTNLYTMGVAGSGAGKEHARKCVDTLLSLTGHGLLLGGTPKSDAGLYQAIKQGNGKRLLQIDEFGKILAVITAKFAAGHLAGIPTMMMEMFSRAHTTYRGAEYANFDGKRARVDIEQPCLCIHATTTPGRLYECMTSADAIDGFLSRWLIFETQDFILDAEPGGSIESPPHEILTALDEWRGVSENVNPIGDLAALQEIKPRTVPFTPEAERYVKSFQRQMRLEMKVNIDKKTGFDAIYARTAEHAQKLALATFEGDAIDADTFNWAAAMALSRSQYLAHAVQTHIADNHHEADIKKVIRIIGDGGARGMTSSELSRKTQFLGGKKRRKDILEDLLENGQLELLKVETPRQPTYYYRIPQEGEWIVSTEA